MNNEKTDSNLNFSSSSMVSCISNTFPTSYSNNINKSLYDYIQNIIFYTKNYNHKSYVTSSNWDNNLIENNHITSIGNIMYTNYSIWLIIASLILILAMVGAIIITIKQDR